MWLIFCFITLVCAHTIIDLDTGDELPGKTQTQNRNGRGAAVAGYLAGQALQGITYGGMQAAVQYGVIGKTVQEQRAMGNIRVYGESQKESICVWSAQRESSNCSQAYQSCLPPSVELRKQTGYAIDYDLVDSGSYIDGVGQIFKCWWRRQFGDDRCKKADPITPTDTDLWFGKMCEWDPKTPTFKTLCCIPNSNDRIFSGHWLLVPSESSTPYPYVNLPPIEHVFCNFDAAENDNETACGMVTCIKVGKSSKVDRANVTGSCDTLTIFNLRITFTHGFGVVYTGPLDSDVLYGHIIKLTSYKS